MSTSTGKVGGIAPGRGGAAGVSNDHWVSSIMVQGSILGFRVEVIGAETTRRGLKPSDISAAMYAPTVLFAEALTYLAGPEHSRISK